MKSLFSEQTADLSVYLEQLGISRRGFHVRENKVASWNFSAARDFGDHGDSELNERK